MARIDLVLNCVMCRRVKDEEWDGTSGGEWCPLVDYLRRHQMSVSDLIPSETYCPDCSLSYDRLITYGKNGYEIT